MDLAGKVVIVTGGSAGVGAATARQLADRGAKLMLVARGRGPLEAVAAELRGRTAVSICPLDVIDADACAAMFEQTVAELGRVDVLINNAGAHARGPLEAVEAERLARMVRVNLEAPIRLSRMVLPYLRDAGGGAIINVGSLAGRTPLPGSATYGATKAGLRSFSHALADELADSGIKVALVSPGPIDTGFIMDELHTVSDLTLSQPMCTADDVARVIVDLLGPGATVERPMPRSSGVLTMVAYVAPWLVKPFRPLLQRKGARVRARIMSARGDESG